MTISNRLPPKNGEPATPQSSGPSFSHTATEAAPALPTDGLDTQPEAPSLNHVPTTAPSAPQNAAAVPKGKMQKLLGASRALLKRTTETRRPPSQELAPPPRMNVDEAIKFLKIEFKGKSQTQQALRRGVEDWMKECRAACSSDESFASLVHATHTLRRAAPKHERDPETMIVFMKSLITVPEEVREYLTQVAGKVFETLATEDYAAAIHLLGGRVLPAHWETFCQDALSYNLVSRQPSYKYTRHKQMVHMNHIMEQALNAAYTHAFKPDNLGAMRVLATFDEIKRGHAREAMQALKPLLNTHDSLMPILETFKEIESDSPFWGVAARHVQRTSTSAMGLRRKDAGEEAERLTSILQAFRDRVGFLSGGDPPLYAGDNARP